ncbi:cytochrome c3 family protein [Malonomonas rubra]|uniref:cytochrome c3 family protein n=1 Tax=Malonomonas rubra TaxID=57040 RepID=UPI0026EFA1A5|nr:cytochrome c3 family protein [Malonomonas rubra]
MNGSCVECHTMHNSQGGLSMRFDSTELTGAAALLRAGSCTGCHADATRNTNIDTSAGPDYTLIPQVDGQFYTEPGTTGNTLAGGTFHFVANDKTTGHNIVDLSEFGHAVDLTSPPGYDVTIAQSVGLPTTWGALTCAGVNGCHGEHSDAFNQPLSKFGAISGAHHESDATIDGTTVGKSYRFLKGVLGVEDDDWEGDADADHNVYHGVDRLAAGANEVDSGATISSLCGQCHGKFHSSENNNVGEGVMSNPWLRHPTDIDMMMLAGTSEYAAYEYDMQAPVAANLTVTVMTTSAVDSDYQQKIVTCVSCHRAHGSPYEDLLRWSYAGMDAGTAGATAGTGCFLCHTSKDGVEPAVIP